MLLQTINQSVPSPSTGVIVLVFILCWLPFHVGRTIFFFSLGSDRQDTYMDNNSHIPSDSSIDRSNKNDSHMHPSQIGRMPAHILTERGETVRDIFAKVQISTDVDTHLATTETETYTEMHKQSNEHTPPTTRTRAHTVTPMHLYNPQNDTAFNSTYIHPDSQYFLYYLSQYFNLVSSVLFYLSAAVNPLLYNLMSARYRLAVHSLIHTHSHTQTQRLHILTARHSTTTI